MKPFTYQEMFLNEDTYFWFVGKQAFIRSALSGFHKKTPQILDIGCGTGGTTKFLSKWGDVMAIEKNKRAASFARQRGLNVIHASANKIPFKDAAFDLVTIFDVLYHKGIDEKAVLSEVYRVLKPGGMLIVTDCAMPSLWSRHDQIMDAKYRYTKESLMKFIRDAGFTIRHAQYMFALLYPLTLLSRISTIHSTNKVSLPHIPSFFNVCLTKLLVLEASLFPFHHPFPGSSIIVSAYKK